MSWMVTMWEWLRAEAAFASRAKRSRRSRLDAASGRTTLMATVRSSRVSRAR